MRMQILLIHGFMLNRDVRKRILKNFDDLKKMIKLNRCEFFNGMPRILNLCLTQMDHGVYHKTS